MERRKEDCVLKASGYFQCSTLYCSDRISFYAFISKNDKWLCALNLFCLQKKKQRISDRTPVTDKMHKYVRYVNVYTIWELLTIQTNWCYNGLIARKWPPILSSLRLLHLPVSGSI